MSEKIKSRVQMNPGFFIAYERSAAGIGITAAVIVAAAAPAVIIATAAPNDDQQDDDPAAVAAAPTIIVTHSVTSYENVDRKWSQSIVCGGKEAVTIIFWSWESCGQQPGHQRR